MTKTAFAVDVSGQEHDEHWMPIPGFEGYYEASTLGRIRSVDRVVNTRAGGRRRWRGRILKLQLRSNTGYLVAGLAKDGVVRDHYVHRLVLSAFRGAPADGQEGCHNNDIRTDNRLDNLRWDTHLANVGDAIARDRHVSIGSYNGEKTHCHRGHPFDADNTIIRPTGRACRECRRSTERIRYHRNKG